MTSPGRIEVDVAQLGPLRRIGVGGQGTVHELINGPDTLVYKEYSPRVVDDLDVAALKRFVRFTRELEEEDANALTARAAWPVNVVRKNGVVHGFVMPRVPTDYSVEMNWAKGPGKVLGQVQFLLNGKAYLSDRGLEIDDRFRLGFLRDTARTLALFHRLGITVGDLSPNNLLFSPTDPPRCFFIDCDAMRLGEDAVLDPVETPDWRVADLGAEDPATPASDSHKFGLLVVRLFAEDQFSRDPRAVPTRLRRLAARSLAADPGARPALQDWEQPLAAALRLSPRAQNRSAGPVSDRAAEPAEAAGSTRPADTRPPAARRRRSPVRSYAAGAAAAGPLVAIVIGVVTGLLSGSSGGSSGPASLAGSADLTQTPGLTSSYQPGRPLGANPYAQSVPNPVASYLRTYNPYTYFLVPTIPCLHPLYVPAPGVKPDPDAYKALDKYFCALDESDIDSAAGTANTVFRQRTQRIADDDLYPREVTGISTRNKTTKLVTMLMKGKGGICRRMSFTISAGDTQSVSAVSSPVVAKGC